MSIKFVSRKDVFDSNTTLAWQVFDNQETYFNPSENLLSAGDSAYLDIDDDTPTILSPELAEKWNNDYIEYCNSMRDEFDPTPSKVDLYEQIIAELPQNSREGFFDIFGKKISLLFEHLNWAETSVVASSPIPYLVQKNDYPPVKTSTKNLKAIGISKSYSDGFVLTKPTTDTFFKNIFWITRCNASAPEILFSGAHSSIIGMLCQYGNIHFNCYNSDAKIQLTKALAEVGFIVAEDGYCRDSFSGTRITEERSLEI